MAMAPCAAAKAASADSLVRTVPDCGPAQGAWMAEPVRPAPGSSQPAEQVAVWRGLPYAAPPVGPLRWQPPQPPACWAGTYDATHDRAFCVQAFTQSTAGIGGEDCLYLTVHVPAGLLNGTSPSRPPAPVFLYIHGGGLNEGSGEFETVAALAVRTRVIVVTINYRLNLFGFLALSELTAEAQAAGAHAPPANWGFLDQQAAMRWVQRNIAAFGGDPTRVTLGGQSSGGTSIFAQFGSPGARGLFAGAIALSGSINVSMGLPAAEAQNAPLVAQLGCAAPAGSSPAAVAARLACLRRVDAKTLAKATPPSWGVPGIWGMEGLTPAGRAFAGVAVVDGVVVTRSFADALAAGDLPGALVVGNMGQESDLGPEQPVYNLTRAALLALLQADVAPWKNAAMAETLLDAYAGDLALGSDRAYCSINTDYGLTCGTQGMIAAMPPPASASGPAVYTFVNQWAPSHNVLGAPDAPVRWAYHTWDWSAVCENWGKAWLPRASDWQLAAFLQTHFAAFFHTATFSAEWPDARSAGAGHAVAFVIDSPASNASGSGRNGSVAVLDYKSSQCALLGSYGFDDRFWWCD